MLNLVFMFPFIGIVLLIITSRDKTEKLKKIALEWSLFTLTAAILL